MNILMKLLLMPVYIWLIPIVAYLLITCTITTILAKLLGGNPIMIVYGMVGYFKFSFVGAVKHLYKI